MADSAQYVEIERHPPPTGFLARWIFSTDHKVIGVQYLLLAIVAAFTGMGADELIDLVLRVVLAPGDVVMREFGFTVDHVVERAKALIGEL